MKTMKHWTLLFLLGIISLSASAQAFTPTFTLVNPQIINGGTHFQFDIQMHCSSPGSYHARGQVYLNYNTAAFGVAVAPNAVVEKRALMSETFSNAPKYTIINVVDNRADIIAITWANNFLTLPPSPLFHTEVPTVATDLIRVTFPIVDGSKLAGIDFNTPLMMGQQFRIVAADDNDPYDEPANYNNNGFQSAALPLQLMSFQAEPLADAIQLGWVSEQEQDFKGYALQRSTDGRNFNEIAWVDGLVDAHNAYTYTDKAVRTGTLYYYRLKMLDIDGQFSYSPIRSAALAAKDVRDPFLYPNPIAGSPLIIDWRTFRPESVLVYNAIGTLVQRMTVPVGEGVTYLSTDQLRPGTYFINATTSQGESKRMTFLKI